MTKVRATINHLRLCQRARIAGMQTSLTTSATWLVNQAINRRAGWPDDPSHIRGSAMPVNGVYPAKASGDRWCHLRLIAHEINTPRLIVRVQRLGELKAYLLARLPNRFTMQEDY